MYISVSDSTAQTSFSMLEDAELSPPPPYMEHCPLSETANDPHAWPSNYNRRSQRIDLAKFYHDILIQSQQLQNSHELCEDHENLTCQDSEHPRNDTSAPLPRVSFSTEPPMIHEYEAVYDSSDDEDDDDEPMDLDQLLIDAWPGHPRKIQHSQALRKIGSQCTHVAPWPPLDLRPIQNSDYKPIPIVAAKKEENIIKKLETSPFSTPAKSTRTPARRRPSVLLRTLTLFRSVSLK